jgi:cephalosporin hydroxylase
MLQAREVFMKQRWLGVAAMQQPFDFLAIADIIYEVQPDVILETGEHWVDDAGCTYARGEEGGGRACIMQHTYPLSSLLRWACGIRVNFAQPAAL